MSVDMTLFRTACAVLLCEHSGASEEAKAACGMALRTLEFSPEVMWPAWDCVLAWAQEHYPVLLPLLVSDCRAWRQRYPGEVADAVE